LKKIAAIVPGALFSATLNTASAQQPFDNNETLTSDRLNQAFHEVRAPRNIANFNGVLGPDLSYAGYTQCYGWKNDGVTPVPDYAYIRDNGGTSNELNDAIAEHVLSQSGTNTNDQHHVVNDQYFIYIR